MKTCHGCLGKNKPLVSLRKIVNNFNCDVTTAYFENFNFDAGERLLCDTCKHKMNKRIETTRNKFIQKTGCLCSGTVSNGKFSGQGFVTTTCTSTGPANSVSSSSTKHQRSRTSITTRKHDKLQTSQDDVIFISSKKASSSVQHKRPLLPDTNHSISAFAGKSVQGRQHIVVDKRLAPTIDGSIRPPNLPLPSTNSLRNSSALNCFQTPACLGSEKVSDNKVIKSNLEYTETKIKKFSNAKSHTAASFLSEASSCIVIRRLIKSTSPIRLTSAKPSTQIIAPINASVNSANLSSSRLPTLPTTRQTHSGNVAGACNAVQKTLFTTLNIFKTAPINMSKLSSDCFPSNFLKPKRSVLPTTRQTYLGTVASASKLAQKTVSTKLNVSTAASTNTSNLPLSSKRKHHELEHQQHYKRTFMIQQQQQENTNN